MDILSSFGLEPKLFAAQIVNFLVIVLIVRVFLYGPISTVLKNRQLKIKQGLDDSQAATALLASTAREKAEILKSARLEMQAIIDSARGTADQIKQKMIDDSRREAEAILAQGKMEARREMERMEKQVGALSLDLSQRVLSSIIPELFTEEQKAVILRKAVENVSKESHGRGNA